MRVEDRKIIDAIMVELNHFKFSRSSISYQYLIDAIHIVVKSPISKKYETKPENVQWSLSKLIDLMYSNTPSDVIYDYFRFFMDEKPTLKFFIITVARNVYDNQVGYG